MNCSNYNRNLKLPARALRKDGTLGEVVLWTEVLSRRQFYGYRFNRQFSMLNYIVDFVCRKLRLIV
ncbi:MAG: DUF559 domain-containing protein [Catalinimonas sp.]